MLEKIGSCLSYLPAIRFSTSPQMLSKASKVVLPLIALLALEKLNQASAGPATFAACLATCAAATAGGFMPACLAACATLFPIPTP